MSVVLEKVKPAAEAIGASDNPLNRSLARLVTMVMIIILAAVGLVGFGLYKAGHGIFGYVERHGPHTVNSATIDGKVRLLALPQAASQLMGATAPYDVPVKVGKGFGGDWKYLHGKWGVWESRGTVGFDADYGQIHPMADTATRTETLVMPGLRLLPATVHESGGRWKDGPHCGVTGHIMTTISLGFDHACSIDSGDPKVRQAIDQAVAAQVPGNAQSMQKAEQDAEATFGPLVASIIKSVTGQAYTIKFVWPSR